jgi:hypothetical protein
VSSCQKEFSLSLLSTLQLEHAGSPISNISCAEKKIKNKDLYSMVKYYNQWNELGNKYADEVQILS